MSLNEARRDLTRARADALRDLKAAKCRLKAGQAKHSMIDAHKLAVFLRGEMLPQANARHLGSPLVPPMRQRTALLAHIHRPTTRITVQARSVWICT
jgi:hypothetical protein